MSIRRQHRLIRRQYHVPAPNYLWHIDGYDMLKPYGLCIHGCVNGQSRKVMWLNVYKSNNDPEIIGGYYFEPLARQGAAPHMIRGGLGTENVKIRDMQRFLHRDNHHTSYIDGSSAANQRIESSRGQLRMGCMQYWMDIFRSLHEQGLRGHTFIDKQLPNFYSCVCCM